MKIIKDKKQRVQIPTMFNKISKNELIPGDILLFLNGNRMTEWHGKNRKKKYGRSSKPPYHAAIVYKNLPEDPDVLILDQEIRSTLSFLSEYTDKKNLRIDVVRPLSSIDTYKSIQRRIKNIAIKEKYYDWKGFGSFASQMPYIGWMFPWVRPSKDTFYCSDIVAYMWEMEGIEVSPRGHNFTAPVDLQLYGIEHYPCYTLKIKGELI